VSPDFPASLAGLAPDPDPQPAAITMITVATPHFVRAMLMAHLVVVVVV
jgi:hypothetical protein